jgi:serine/threonine protein kinase/formylglycine-generating enzyme required for sulfatase activity
MTWAPPREFEEYRIVRPLGAGQMGTVFLAHDTLLDRPVAIKFISAIEVGPGARERFFTEARAVARLSHPNVVAVHRVGEVGRRPFLVSEYLRGPSLAALPKPLPWERALRIAIGLARGLGAAHRAGVLHRDIKPANVMLGDDDEAKLLDFGLAKLAGSGQFAIPVIPEEAVAPVRERSADVDATQSLAASPGIEAVGEPTATAPAVVAPASETREGVLLGTPLYLAPERWAGAAASQASDVYALGVVLYELLAGRAPYAGLAMAELMVRARDEDVPPIARQVAELPAQLAELVDSCVARDPRRRPASGDALCDRLEAVVPRALPVITGSPYRGLASFESEHRAMFFGRAAEARAVVERLRTETFVMVVGDSGAGKSSLCRAAVLPAVLDKSLAGTRWRAATMVPGARPMARLAAALADRRADEGLLLFIDQLEELWTLAPASEAAEVARRLAELVVASSAVRVLASARSDYLGRLAGLPGLGELVGRALFLLGPMRDQGLVDAILGPARAAGYAFESAETIHALVASGRHHLPLLQFALSELWDARDEDRRLIPKDALARIGGVTGALARHADSVLAGQPPSERIASRAILRALVTADGTRARRSHVELIDLAARVSARADAALDALVRGRLLVVQEAESGAESSYAIAHEALLTGWDTLRGWLAEEAQHKPLRQRVERAAAEWHLLGRAPETLWTERQLRDVAALDPRTLATRDAAFLDASRAAAARRRLARRGLALGLPLAIASTLAAVHLDAARARGGIVDEQWRALVAARIEGARFAARRAEAFAKFDAGAPDAEDAWRAVLRDGPDVDRRYAGVCERLERLLQDAADPAARALLIDALIARAELAEAAGDAGPRDAMIERLAVHGARARWALPAQLVVDVEPGALVSLRRYAAVDDRLVERDAIVLGRTPLVPQAVAPGSAVLEVDAPGKPGVRLPILLERGRTARVRFEVPAADRIPAGFLYVPPGEFLYGTAGGEDARMAFGTQPIHRVLTGPYLIAMHETTYGEWLAFLRSLPDGRRAPYTPDIVDQSYLVKLTELPDRQYQLALGFAPTRYAAREDQAIRYRDRAVRVDQAWSRMPVSGVPYEAVFAYAAWLRATGRVPGARPCNEHEWERAARGADGRAFPAGALLGPDDANVDVTYGRRGPAFGPDEVGAHPASRSPFGVDDVAGNVWEWTASIHDPRVPVARGGSFFQAASLGRPEQRSEDIAGHPDPFYGVRICADLGSP